MLQGSKHHALDLVHDIHELMKLLRTHHIYSQKLGCTIEGKKADVPDILAVGMQGLVSPLQDYNSMFERLHAQCCVNPLIRQPWKPAAVYYHI